jgi:cytochrome c-type biogenesis protein CcmF
VGPPYFNSVFIPLTLPLVVLIGVGALARWKQDDGAALFAKLRVPMLLSLVLGVTLPAVLAPSFHWGAALGVSVAFWILFTTLLWFKERAGNGRLAVTLANTSRAQWGMVLGHLGVAVFVVGITLTSLYSSEKDVRLAPGESYHLGGYDFKFLGAKHLVGPNYDGDHGFVEVYQDGRLITLLEPEKRIYRVSQMPMTEAGIDAGLFRDLFVALGEPLGDQGAWSLRLYHKPFVRWIWLGALIMSLGGLLAALDRRYYRLARRAEAARGVSATAA